MKRHRFRMLIQLSVSHMARTSIQIHANARLVRSYSVAYDSRGGWLSECRSMGVRKLHVYAVIGARISVSCTYTTAPAFHIRQQRRVVPLLCDDAHARRRGGVGPGTVRVEFHMPRDEQLRERTVHGTNALGLTGAVAQDDSGLGFLRPCRALEPVQGYRRMQRCVFTDQHV